MAELKLMSTDSRRTAHEIVRDTLRQAILRGSLPGGTRLVQADIASQLKISTTPVREALRDLATEGLITLDPHRGAVVKRLSYEELQEIHDLCILLEPEAVRRAATEISSETLARAAELVEEMERETDVGTWADLNRQFHAILVSEVQAPRLLSILRGLRDSAAPYVRLALHANDEHTKEANSDHRELLHALEDGDAERAATLAQEHLLLTTRVLEGAKEHFETV